jgi:hypothetical protein
MKTKELTFTTIQQIKRNNLLMEKFVIIEDLVSKIYLYDQDIERIDINNLKNIIPNDNYELTVSEYIYCIWNFAEEMQTLLKKDSEKLLNN